MKNDNRVNYNSTYINIGTGPTVLLLHGPFGNLDFWKPIVDELKDDFHVIVPKLPVFELTLEQINVRSLTQLIHTFIDFHQLEDVTIIGHEIGGQIALMYARSHPENVSRLVLTGSSGVIERSPILETDGEDGASYEYVRKKINESFYNRGHIPRDLTNQVYATVKSISKRIALFGLARSSKSNRLDNFLHTIRQPVLLIWGLQDTTTPPEAALRFHDLLPNSELKFIDQCAHLPMLEKPVEFNAHVRLFLNGLTQHYRSSKQKSIAHS